MSPVLQDAVRITRFFLVPFLWVDSLCIIQYDISDWQRQCSQMNDVYGRALITVIVASSRSCKEGFLNPKRYGLRFLCRSMRHPDINGSFIVYFTHAYSWKDRGSPDCQPQVELLQSGVLEDLYCCQWARGGLTFQRDAMTGFRIFIGETGIYFGSNGVYKTTLGFASVNHQSFSVESFQNAPLDNWYDACKEIIVSYSRFTSSSSTDPTDLLPALSGITKLFSSRIRAQFGYIAGHWAEDRLWVSLLWGVLDLRVDASFTSLSDLVKELRQKQHLVPGRTCLGRGEIGQPYRHLDGHSESTILDVHSHPIGDDPYGAVHADASLALERCIYIRHGISFLVRIAVRSAKDWELGEICREPNR